MLNPYFLLLALFSCSLSLISEPPLPYVKGRLLVKIDQEKPIQPLMVTAESIGAKNIHTYSIVKGLVLYQFDESIDVEKARQIFMLNPAVIYAEPDYLYESSALNDPEFPRLWALENSGQNGGVVDADVNAEKMWEIEQGSDEIVVGIIDTGVDYTHQDLADNIWYNSEEIPNNNKDDDNNGFVDDIHGINAITESGNPMDDHAHGTHVAGTIGAKGNNSIGVVGMAQHVKIAACKFLSSSGFGANSDAIQCLDYFAKLKSRPNNPVNLIATNNSWGGGSQSQAMLDALKVHESLGVLFIAAAGNEANNNDINERYPCNYNLTNVISVAATDNKDRLASFSNYGKKTVHIAAPGVKILSTLPQNRYGELSGTSMATPHVTGMAAIIASHFKDLGPLGIKNLIISGGQKISSAKSTTMSGRRLRGADENGVGSLTCAQQILSMRRQPLGNEYTLPVGQELLLSAIHINCAQPSGPLTLFDNGANKITLEDNGTGGDLIAHDGVYSLLWQPLNPGVYELDFGNDDKVKVTVYQKNSFRNYHAVPQETFSWEKIEGEALKTQDEAMHTYTSLFPIHFASSEQGFDHLYISSNGTISFTDEKSANFKNLNLPIATMNTLVAPYWDDLTVDKEDSDIYVAVTGELSHRKLVIEWRNMRNYRSHDIGSFQVVFFEDSPNIQFNYLDTDFGNPSFDNGMSATIGIQTAFDTAVEYGFNKEAVSSQSSILFELEEKP